MSARQRRGSGARAAFRSAPALLAFAATLGGSAPGGARTPLPPPTPPHCARICKGSAARCVQRCRGSWQALPWRERLVAAYPAAARCTAPDQRCRARCARGDKPRCAGACQRRLEPCVRRALGLRPATLRRCWIARLRREKPCAGREGRGGWWCRQEARERFQRCVRPTTRRLTRDALRIALDLDEAMVRAR